MPASAGAKPWATGPGEILDHALALLSDGSEAECRIAMILVDNSVELIIRTWISLPRRITGMTLTRKQISEATDSFPSLLDALEQHGASHLDGIDLGEVEWYHRLRNQLYHDGNGLTVEADRVRVYAELASVLFERLFGTAIKPHGPAPPDAESSRIGHFVHGWSVAEGTLLAVAEKLKPTEKRPHHLLEAVELLRSEGMVPSNRFEQLNRLRTARNAVVHGHLDQSGSVSAQLVADMEDFLDWIEEIGKRLC